MTSARRKKTQRRRNVVEPTVSTSSESVNSVGQSSPIPSGSVKTYASGKSCSTPTAPTPVEANSAASVTNTLKSMPSDEEPTGSARENFYPTAPVEGGSASSPPPDQSEESECGIVSRQDMLRAYMFALDTKRLHRKKILGYFFANLGGVCVFGKRPNHKRKFNLVRNRMKSKPDSFFKRMFRLDRSSFAKLVDMIKDQFGRDRRGAPSVPLTIQLAATLRLLAGGSYLDIAFGFNLNHTNLMTTVWKVLECIDEKLDNINFPLNDIKKLRELE
eukprot:CAMPEP_0174900828 /NCGR_PEP_ID=MMETSP0167-20121228/32620_1 /TAXON_ID=38298 /ORGANISM="Rhodella maculata, Strain CCMP736" /LENGTH=273 /DNA_ID=CAMNT_0016142355 /DNA_START=46 /DNA_END=864 /DNA_ORIENTATION=-